MMSNYLKGRQAALDTFRRNVQGFPFWKVYELSNKHSVFKNLEVFDDKKSLQLFQNTLNDLYPEKIYIVCMYRNIADRKGGQKFIKPNFEYSFLMDRGENQIEPQANVNGHEEIGNNGYIPMPNIPPMEQHRQPPTPPMPYGVNMGQQIGLADHVGLITAKAKAESDVLYLTNIVSDQAKKISQLERELEELEEEYELLEEEIETLENQMEEEEKQKEHDAIAGENKPTSMESAISSLVEKHGGVILENIFDKGGLKDSPSFEETDNATVNGIEKQTFTPMDISLLNERMLKINPKWEKHLLKLVLIGEQKPSTFKMFIEKLEAFK